MIGVRLFVAGVAGLAVSSAFASISSISHGDAVTGSHVGNLITNGSFEDGNPSGTNYGWTPGTHLGGYPASDLAIPSWTASWPTGAYGWWGALGFGGAPNTDGNNGVYFGNSFNSVGTTYSVAASGVITFNGAPSLSGRPAPVVLGQTLTGLNTSTTYHLDFWASGESDEGAFVGVSMFGLDISGEPLQYLQLPGASSGYGASERFYVDFVPTSSTVTINFVNWGHMTDMGGGTGSELILDDVIVNAPAPASLSLLGVAGLIAGRRRRA